MEIPIFADDAGQVFVQESDYFALLSHIRQLILDQKAALRSHNASAIADCQRREAAFLHFAAQYTTGRANHPNIKK